MLNTGAITPGLVQRHLTSIALIWPFPAGSLVSVRMLITQLKYAQNYPLCCVTDFLITISIPSQAGSASTNTGTSGPAREKEQEQDLFPQQEAENEHGDCYLPVLMDNALTRQAHFPKSIDCFQVRCHYMSLLQ